MRQITQRIPYYSTDDGESLYRLSRPVPGQIVRCLEVRPELRRGIECLREQPCGLGRDATLAANQLVDALDRYTEMCGDRDLGDAERDEEFLTQDHARVRGDAILRKHAEPPSLDESTDLG